MVYEDMTYEVIQKRMMDRTAANYPNLDDREGSLIFNAHASSAVEMAIMYTELENTRKESFVPTASREFILLGCEQMGMDVSVFEANAGVFKGEFNIQVPIGSRWNCDLFNYEVTEFIGMNGEYYTYQMLCDTVGTAANNQTGDLTPISDNVAGLEYAKVTECLIEGENETPDEDIVAAYYNFVNNNVSDGNVAQYKRWCDEYDGIGNSKVFPLWNGVNTVKVSILSASNTAASSTLIEEFQNYLDPNCEGMGNGVAPIGAFVTVTTATEVPITVGATLTMTSGYTDTSGVTAAVEKYLSTIAYEKTTVAYMNVGAIILNVDGVEAVNNLKLNGGTADVTLGSEDIPVLGTTSWVVA